MTWFWVLLVLFVLIVLFRKSFTENVNQSNNSEDGYRSTYDHAISDMARSRPLFKDTERSNTNTIVIGANTKEKPSLFDVSNSELEVITVSERFNQKTDKYTEEVNDYRVVQGLLGSEKVVAEVPYKIKEVCDKMMRNREGSFYDAEFMHDNYWVIVWYKGIRHAYKGTDDIWTYSARELPELNTIHNWIYKLLGVKKPRFKSSEIETMETWIDDSNRLWGIGKTETLQIEFNSSLRGRVRKYSLQSKDRFNDTASYNSKTKVYHFPFYYSDCEKAIADWSDEIFKQHKT